MLMAATIVWMEREGAEEGNVVYSNIPQNTVCVHRVEAATGSILSALNASVFIVTFDFCADTVTHSETLKKRQTGRLQS